jgi:hypothetical protein
MYNNTALGRACTGLGLILGSILYIIILFSTYFIGGYNIVAHKYLYIFIFTAVILLVNALTYYIYYNRKRYHYISSEQFKPFKLKKTAGLIINGITIIISLSLFMMTSIFIGNCL